MPNVKLLTMPGCSHCGPAKDLLLKVAPDFPNVDVEVLDVVEDPGLSMKYNLLQAPGLVIDEKLVSSGGFDEPGLRKMLGEA